MYRFIYSRVLYGESILHPFYNLPAADFVATAACLPLACSMGSLRLLTALLSERLPSIMSKSPFTLC